jgi:6-phosphogluconolactonase (cycloisomerase 2 family)
MRVMSRWVLTLSAVVIVAALTSCSNSNNGSTSTTGFMFVTTQGDQKVSSYTINLGSGSVSSATSSAASGLNPTAMTSAVTSSTATLFVANVDDNCGSAGSSVFCDQIRPFTINSDGTIGTAGTPIPVTTTTSSTPLGMALSLTVDPTGAFLFVTHQGNSFAFAQGGAVPGTISVFQISGTSLTQVSGSPFLSALPGEVTGNGPSGVVVAPSGNFLYVSDQFTGNIAAYSYDSTGTITLINAYPSGTNPAGLAFSRCAGISAATPRCTAGADGNVLFVANSGSNSVSAFTSCIQVSTTCANADGTLTAVSGSPFPAGNGPISVVADPVADFVYAVDRTSFQVSQYQFSPATGALSPVTPSASTGSSPLSGAITTDGSWFFVANNGASSLSAYSVGTGGRLNAATTSSVPLAGQPSAVLIR